MEEPIAGADAGPQVPGVTISPKTAQVGFGGQVEFTATVTALDGGVLWGVAEGAAGGTITDGGVYAPRRPSPAPSTHTVTSVVNSAKYRSGDHHRFRAGRHASGFDARRLDQPHPAERIDLNISEPKFGIPETRIDPSDPYTIYLCVDQQRHVQVERRWIDIGPAWAIRPIPERPR